jgi:hypothetical protein
MRKLLKYCKSEVTVPSLPLALNSLPFYIAVLKAYLQRISMPYSFMFTPQLLIYLDLGVAFLTGYCERNLSAVIKCSHASAMLYANHEKEVLTAYLNVFGTN